MTAYTPAIPGKHVMTEKLQPEATPAANAVAEKYDSRVVVYSGDIDNIGVGRLLESLRLDDSTRPNTFLILTTNGGQADAAYRIARLLQLVSERFYLFVPERCKSAGTLLALGANEIIMSPIAELGPLDVQLVQRNEIDRIRSGLVVHTALKGLADETLRAYEQMMLQIKYKSRGSVSFEVASQIAASITTGVMSSVYAQVKPEDLGRDLRDLHVATAYGERLVEHGENVKHGAVRHLVEDYPTHSFIIDASEAKTLFKKVSEPLAEATALIRILNSASLLDVSKSPCYVSRLDAKENQHGETASGAAEGSAGLDDERQDPGAEDPQGRSRAAGKRRTASDAKRTSA